MKKSTLAIYGGIPLRRTKFPVRKNFNYEEKKIILQLLNNTIKKGSPIRYSGFYEDIYKKKFTKFMGGGYCDLVNSGTNALLCSLASLDLKPGDEVLVPVINDVGGVTPIIMLNLIPKPIDIDNESYNTSISEIKKNISKKTKAVIVCHIGGEPARIDEIYKYLKKKKIFLIEDCSQSHGAKYKGKKIGSFGDIAFFSTMSSKHHCTGGTGGVVYSKNKKLINKVEQFADRGKIFKNNKFTGINSTLGLNCTLDDISAAIGVVQLDKLKKIIKSTNFIGDTIKNKLSKINSPSSITNKNSYNVYWFIRIKLDLNKISVSKEEYCRALKAEGINLDSEYKYNPFLQPWFRKKNFNNFFNNKFIKKNNFNIKNFPNYLYAMNNYFNIYIRENYKKKEISDIVNAINKVDNFFKIKK